MRETGVVKWFKKEYGFIRRADGSDAFVHKSAVRSGFLQEGDRVDFELKKGPKGWQALDVAFVSTPNMQPSESEVPDQSRHKREMKEGGLHVGPPVPVTTMPEASDFAIIFDPELSEDQAAEIFLALADYFRACGGTGLAARFEYQKAEVTELVYA